MGLARSEGKTKAVQTEEVPPDTRPWPTPYAVPALQFRLDALNRNLFRLYLRLAAPDACLGIRRRVRSKYRPAGGLRSRSKFPLPWTVRFLGDSDFLGPRGSQGGGGSRETLHPDDFGATL